MNVSDQELILIIQGAASTELQDRFLREGERPLSRTCKVLCGVELWARAHLNPKCPSPAAHSSVPGAASEIPRVIKKAAFADEIPRSVRSVNIDDLIEYIRGTASPETTALVKSALDNPGSALFKMLVALKERTNG